MLLFVAAVNTPIAGRYFFEIRFYDWRINAAACWLLLSCIPLATFFLGSCFRGKTVKFFTHLMTVGCFVLFPLVFVAVCFITQFKQAYDSKLLSEVAVGAAVYRLYEETPNYVPLAIPCIYVAKEWDTPFGFKLVRYRWGAANFCGTISLRLSTDHAVDIVATDATGATDVIFARLTI